MNEITQQLERLGFIKVLSADWWDIWVNGEYGCIRAGQRSVYTGFRDIICERTVRYGESDKKWAARTIKQAEHLIKEMRRYGNVQA